jgi:hypothetical protein
VLAQGSAGSIGGNVRDATGSVLPGVTVEAASPALIEKVRTVVTDDQGNYKIVDLRPGTYSVTFALTGFSTLKREGIELNAGFTATVNADMKVGALEERVNVSGSTPIVDVQNSRVQQVVSGEVLDALPVGTKTLQQFVSITLGAVNSSANRNDVGGDQGETATGMSLHGSRGDDGRTNWDGMSTNVFFGNGGGKERVYLFNTVGVQEVVVDAGGNAAESETGGANINIVPRDGSNAYRVYATAGYTDQNFSSKAVPSDLVARGTPPQPSLKAIYDYGFGIGGPIKTDRLWFFSPNRWWGTEKYAVNSYFNVSTNPYVYTPDLNSPAYNSSFFRDNAIRLTWQAAAKHKINLEVHEQHGCNCWSNAFSGTTAPEATYDFKYGPLWLTQVTWSHPASNKLLLEAGVTWLAQNVSFWSNTALNSSRFTAVGNSTFPGPQNFSILELTGVPGGAPAGYTYGALPYSTTAYGGPDNQNNYNQRFTASYITGSHAFKAGLQMLQGHFDSNGLNVPNQVTYTFRNGVPVSLTEWAGPFVFASRLRQVGIFAQDQWTLRRLTFNAGVRFDQFWAYALPVTKPAGPLVGALSFPESDNLPNYKDITPRAGASYDVFGNGKTAIKASFGRYLYGQGGAIVTAFGPANSMVTNATRTWTPAAGNFVPNCDLKNLQANGECGQASNLLFGQPFSNTTLADDARRGWGVREYDYQTSLQLQQELRPGIGINVGYFRTWWGNLTVRQNTLVSPTDFTSFCITAPTDARLGQFSGQEICGLYDVNPSKFGQVNNVITLGKNFGTPEEVYNGFEVGFNARPGKGALLQGGLSLGRDTIDYCYANNRPDLTPANSPQLTLPYYPRDPAHCRIESPWWSGIGSQVKLQGIYPLPWEFQLAGTYKNLPGIPLQANMVLTNGQVAPALGRNLAAGPGATVTLPLIAYGTNGDTTQGMVFDQRLNELDLRVSRWFHITRGKLQAMVDLYNVFNNRPAQGVITTYGATWLRPTTLLGGRLYRFGAQVDW